MRNVHYRSANLLVVVAVLHLLRAFFTGAIHGKRRFNWVIGVFLLLCILTANFTGYLLPFDRLSYWAITVCAGMLGYLPGVGPGLQKLIRGGAEIGSCSGRSRSGSPWWPWFWSGLRSSTRAWCHPPISE